MDRCGGAFDMMQTSFFLSRQTLLPSDKPGMPIWREKIFAWMLRNSATAMEFFPPADEPRGGIGERR